MMGVPLSPAPEVPPEAEENACKARDDCPVSVISLE